MTDGEDPSRSHIISVEHPERLMARLRGWDPVEDPLEYGTGLLRSFQHDMFSFFEPFTPPFTDTGYIRPQMLDNALFGYNPIRAIGNVLRTAQESTAQEIVFRQPRANAVPVSLISESGVTEYRSDQQPVTEDNVGSADLDSRRDTDLKKENIETMDSNEIRKDDEIEDEVDMGKDRDVDPEKDKARIVIDSEPPTDLPEVQDADKKIDTASVDTILSKDTTNPEATKQKDNVQGTAITNEENRTDSGIFPEESDVDLGQKTTHLNADQDEEAVPETRDTQSRQDNVYISELDINDQDQTNTSGGMFGIRGMFSMPLDLHTLHANTYEVLNTDMEFRVNMDVMHFKPEEIEIRVVNNRITIHARHGERQDDHGLIEREFTRVYTIPEDTDADHVTSCLYANGVLTVRVPKRNQRITAS